MKMKQVCEQTGLTDRTVRYYIEERLISPWYTENYMGRKAYDFTEADVTALNNIAVLRKVGFTVEEIRQLMASPMRSQEIIAQVRQRKEEAAETEQEIFAVLDRLGRLTDYTVPSLVEALGEAAERAKLPPEKYRPDAYDLFWMAVRGVVYAAVMLAPVAFLVRWLGWFWTYHRYAVCEPENVLCILLALVSTAVLLVAWLRPEWNRNKWKAWGLCLMYLPVSWSCAGHMLGDSMTTDIRYYRVWDFYIAETDITLNSLFPEAISSGWNTGVPSIYNDTDYFYRARARESSGAMTNFGEIVLSDHEIYAEWLLPAERLPEEIDRVDALFREYEGSSEWGWQTCRVQRGDFMCWFLFWEFPLTASADFDPSDPSHTIREYMLFAYDEQSGRVRYGAGTSYNGIWPDFPHFREVAW